MRFLLAVTALLSLPVTTGYAFELDDEETALAMLEQRRASEPVVDAALWQVAPLPSSRSSAALDRFLSPSGILSVLGGLGGLTGLVAWLTQRRKKFIAYAIHHGFMIAENAGIEDDEEDSKVDKAAIALKAIDEWMLKNGWRPLTPEEKLIAELQLQAKHGEEVAKAKVQAATTVTVVAP